MTRLRVLGDGVAIASAVSTLALPPPAFALLSSLIVAGEAPPSHVDLEVWANDTRALTAAEWLEARLHALVVADDTFTAAANVLTATAHTLLTGDGPLYMGSDGVLPTGLEEDVPYYAIRLDANTISVAASREAALAGTVVPVTDAGTGTHTWSDDATTQRVHWHSIGLLGPAEDGAISLTNQRSYATRRETSSRAYAYAIAATFGAGAGLVSARLYPLSEV